MEIHFDDIINIRYAPLDDNLYGKIAFEYKNRVFLIPEPEDVLLVGVPGITPKKWIVENYGFLLANIS